MTTENVITLEDIHKTYIMGKQTVKALDGITVSFKRGSYTALMGSSGSGKSTLMNIIGCLDQPTKGSYNLNGTDVSQMTKSELAEIRNKQIGFVFQTFNLMPRYSALENVALPLIYAGQPSKIRTEKAHLVLEKVGLADRASHKPNELSGGQRQRVAIARALINEPAILLADEPTGNLDSKTSHEVMALFQDLHSSGQTIVMVTHEPDIASHAQQTLVLKDGKLI